jgi:hypothetical protein
MGSVMKNKRPKPLATVGTNPRVEIHRAKFHPFASMKYLNIEALKKAAKAQIEIGRVEGGGAEATIVAEVRKGMITKLRPLACKGCVEGMSKAGTNRRTANAATKKVLREALVRVRKLRQPVTKLPLPLRSVQSLNISIGPIIVVIGPGIDICIRIDYEDSSCVYCLFSPGFCLELGDVVFTPKL